MFLKRRLLTSIHVLLQVIDVQLDEESGTQIKAEFFLTAEPDTTNARIMLVRMHFVMSNTVYLVV